MIPERFEETFFLLSLNVTLRTPPTFLVHAEMKLEFRWKIHCFIMAALRAKGVSASLHVYPKGGHWICFGMGKRTASGKLARWYLLDWMKAL